MKEKTKRRGHKKGFIEGSMNDRLSHVIPEELAEYGALTREDLHLLLGVARTWLVRPVARLLEQGVIVQTPTICLCGKEVACTDRTLHLPGQSPVPDYLRPFTLEDIKGAGGGEDNGSSAVASPDAAPAATTGAEAPAVNDDCAACDQVIGRDTCARCAQSSPRRRSRS